MSSQTPQTTYYLPNRTFGNNSINSLLLFFQPQTIEQKLLLIEAYTIINDFGSAEALIEQLYEDVKNIDIHASNRTSLETSIGKLQEYVLKLRTMMKHNSVIIYQLKSAASSTEMEIVPLDKPNPEKCAAQKKKQQQLANKKDGK